MDEDESPVSYGRLYVIIKEATKHSERDQPMLTPSQIRDLTKEAIKKRPIKQVSKEFLKALETFMNSLASKIERLFFKTSFEDDMDAEEDMDESFMRNFEYLTRNQFNKFFDLVW